jgi:putative hemolysin
MNLQLGQIYNMSTAHWVAKVYFLNFIFVFAKNCPQQVNGLIGGAVAGAAVAARTRSWPQVIGMAGLVSVFCAAADYSRT